LNDVFNCKTADKIINIDDLTSDFIKYKIIIIIILFKINFIVIKLNRLTIKGFVITLTPVLNKKETDFFLQY
jgi:hypothetical protein